MTETAQPKIQVGTIAVATRASGVCDVGETRVCYEVYRRMPYTSCMHIANEGREQHPRSIISCMDCEAIYSRSSQYTCASIRRMHLSRRLIIMCNCKGHMVAAESSVFCLCCLTTCVS